MILQPCCYVENVTAAHFGAFTADANCGAGGTRGAIAGSLASSCRYTDSCRAALLPQHQEELLRQLDLESAKTHVCAYHLVLADVAEGHIDHSCGNPNGAEKEP
jgi:hypothetical protein